MTQIIDLSQEIYEGMPVFRDLPQVKMSIHNSHEEWNGIKNPETKTPAVHKLELGEHTGTHVDAINHMEKKHVGKSIDKMPLSMFYTEGICLDFSHKKLKELISSEEVENVCKKQDVLIKEGDTVLFYTDHYKKYFNTENWKNGPGITIECATYLGKKQVAAFGVETMSPGVSGISNKGVHHVCGDMNFTHYENLINLDKLIDKGRFRFIGLPLKIRGGTGSPVRAIAVIE